MLPCVLGPRAVFLVLLFLFGRRRQWHARRTGGGHRPFLSPGRRLPFPPENGEGDRLFLRRPSRESLVFLLAIIPRGRLGQARRPQVADFLGRRVPIEERRVGLLFAAAAVLGAGRIDPRRFGRACGQGKARGGHDGFDREAAALGGRAHGRSAS